MADSTPQRPEQRRDLSFYFVLLFLVGPLWCAVPLSWAFVLYSLHTGRIWLYAWQGRTVFTVALCEVFFSVYHHNLSRYVASTPPHPPGNPEEVRAAYTRAVKAGLFVFPEDAFDGENLDVSRPGSPAEDIVQLEHDDSRAEEYRNVLRTWFRHAPWSAIRLYEIKKWLYWCIFNSHLPPDHEIPDTHRSVLDEALDLLRKRTGTTVFEESPSKHQPLLLTLDSVKIHWRPFAFYALVGTFSRLLKLYLVRNRHVRFGNYDGLEYLIRIPSQWDSHHGPRPIVFVHGLGLGLLQYHSFVLRLLDEFADRPVFILLQSHISQDFFHKDYLRPMNRHDTTQRLAALFLRLGWVRPIRDTSSDEEEDIDTQNVASSLLSNQKGVTFISHSNGSYCHAWMLKNYPHMVTRSCFVDPVTFCSWEGDVCYNFIYRPCTTGVHLLMRYFVSSELGTANLLQRHFDWSSNSLWYEEIPNARDPSKSFFLVGAKDEIVRAERVARYLRGHGIRKGFWMDPEGRHGSALASGGEGHQAILEWLREE
ncbi:hypothetical protein EYR40_005247 [Pleurotus pulmonarius]|nr:hypothetical protein EYR40_005247 [Pleurotus pulmonarius]